MHFILLILFFLSVFPVVTELRSYQSSSKQAPVQVQLSENIVLRGDSVTVYAVSADSLERPTVWLQTSDNRTRKRAMEKQDGKWRWESHKLTRSLAGEIRLPGSRSASFQIGVVPPPRISLSIERLSPPEYTGEATNDDPHRPLEVLPGSEIVLGIEANRTFSKIKLIENDRGILREARNTADFKHRVVIKDPLRFSVEGHDTYGFRRFQAPFRFKSYKIFHLALSYWSRILHLPWKGRGCFQFAFGFRTIMVYPEH